MQNMNESKDTIINNESSYFFTPNYCLYGHGLFEKITLAAANHQLLNEKIKVCFTQLSKEKNSNPILVGAIPFDTNQPSSLTIYRNHLKTNNIKPNHDIAIQALQLTNQQQVVAHHTFNKAVASAIEAFTQQHLEKIVLSQAVDFDLHTKHLPSELAETLFLHNPYAYNFAIPVEQGGYIIGASPELLLAKNNDNIRSNPLAGSRPRSLDRTLNQMRISELKASSKEIYEHQIVVENIEKTLAPFCQQLKISPQPEILETNTMLHLSSVFEGTLLDPSLNALQLALTLHPTAAVCGAPMEMAKQFILKHEGYARDYYTGLVGWMDAKGNGEWVVTIRCGLLQGQKIRLYAGAGIVQGSNAEKEWQETEAKMQTMLTSLNAKILN